MRIEGEGIEKDVDVFGKTRNEIPAFQQARPALEDDLAAAYRDNPQDFCDVVILFDHGGTQLLRLEVLGGPDDRLIEIRVFEEPHRSGSLACQSRARGRLLSRPKSKRESGLSEERSRSIPGLPGESCS